MGLMFQALKHGEAQAVPVILPLQTGGGWRVASDGERVEDDAAVKGPYPLGAAACPSSPATRHPPPVTRFTFPEVPEPSPSQPAPGSPTVIWPVCDDDEQVRVYAEAAEGVFRQLPRQRPAVVAFTSPGDGDGKTSVLAALTPELARRVTDGILVVDANFRQPDLTARLGMPDGTQAARSALIYPTNLPRLNVLPAPPPQQIRSFDRSWIEDVREAWPLVLLDTASLVHPEAASLARWCDGVYLVVRLGHTSRRAVRQAARVIRGSGGRLLGCVVVK